MGGKRKRTSVEQKHDFGDGFSRSRKKSKRPTISLHPYQKASLQHIKKTNALMLNYDTGMGKTIVACMASAQFIRQHEHGKVIVITPKGLQANFENTFFRKLGYPIQYSLRLVFLTIGCLPKYMLQHPDGGENNMVIIDEAHNLRTNVYKSMHAKITLFNKINAEKETKLYTELKQDFPHLDEKKGDYAGLTHVLTQSLNRSKTKSHWYHPLQDMKTALSGRSLLKSLYVRALAAIDICGQAKKVLLLTATPAINSPDDFCNIYSMLSQSGRVLSSRFWNREANRRKIFQFLQKHTHVQRVQESECRKDFAQEEVHEEFITMSPSYYKLYKRAEQKQLETHQLAVQNMLANPFSFYCGLRQATLAIRNSQKIQWTLNKIRTAVEHKEKVMVFSSFKQMGLSLLHIGLAALGVRWTSITGDVPVAERERRLQDFNQGVVKVILCSQAGGEGMDTKGVGHVIFLDPGWNFSSWEQQKGRAIRYQSHKNMKNPVVHIWNLYYMKPTNTGDRLKEMKCTDMIIRDLRMKKQIEINDYQNMLI